MNAVLETRQNKVPEVTLAFWIIKIAATTLGETAGDALSMTEHLGYAASTAIFFAFFLVTGQQLRSARDPFTLFCTGL